MKIISILIAIMMIACNTTKPGYCPQSFEEAELWFDSIHAERGRIELPLPMISSTD
jgi:hypothetical protein